MVLAVAAMPSCAAISSEGEEGAVEFRADAFLADAFVLGENQLPYGHIVRFVESADRTQLCATVGLDATCLPTPGARPSIGVPTFVQSSTAMVGTLYMLALPPEFAEFTVQDEGGNMVPSGRSINGDYAVLLTPDPEAPLLPFHLMAADRQELATVSL
jgi:hypothetical protein